MKIYLVRHGQDQDNLNKILNGHRDTDLTDLGREQANTIAQHLEGKPIDIIYASPLRRAYDTAWIIAKHLGKGEVITNQIFIERDFGILTGRPSSDIPKYSSELIETEKIKWFINPEGVELFPDLLNRAKKALDMVKQTYPNKNILIVSHGDLSTMMYAAHNNLAWREVLQTTYMENTGLI